MVEGLLMVVLSGIFGRCLVVVQMCLNGFEWFVDGA